MSFIFGGTQANVTISGTVTYPLPLPSSTQVITNINGTGNGSNQNAYTVPASKIFYLYGVSGEGGGANGVYVYLNDGTTRVWSASDNATKTGFLSVNSSVPLAKYTAAQNVVVKWTNTAGYNLYGVLIDA